MIFLAVLLLGISWLMIQYEGLDVSLWQYVEVKFTSTDGLIMLAALVLLAAFYPLFGYMRKVVRNCDLEGDKLRIYNAMQVYGYHYVGERGGAHIYHAAGILQRIMLRFEDEIEVRQVGSDIEIYGIRSRVARIAFQLEGYLNNRRYEDNK